MMILIDGIQYVLSAPASEDALEAIVEKNYQYIFGENAFYFNVKRKLTSSSGIGSIPDAYVIIIDKHPKWCILEVELSSHPIYEHVVSQLTKFNRGIENSASRKKIVEVLYESIKEDQILEARIKKEIESGEIYKFVSELISNEPIIAIAIDEKTNELEEAIKDIKGDIKVLEFKTFAREGMTDGVNAHLFNPIFGSRKIKQLSRSAAITRDKTVKRNEVLRVGMKLKKMYKGKEFVAEVIDNQKISFNGKIYNSVSMAAVAAIRSTGSKRTTEDGWRWWTYKNLDSGKYESIDELRKG